MKVITYHAWNWKLSSFMEYLSKSYGNTAEEGMCLRQMALTLYFSTRRMRSEATMTDWANLLDPEDWESNQILTRLVMKVSEDACESEDPDFLWDLDGREVGVVVDKVVVTKPWRGNPNECPSDYDYLGGTECEWHLINERGKPIDPVVPLEQEQRIEAQIRKNHNEAPYDG